MYVTCYVCSNSYKIKYAVLLNNGMFVQRLQIHWKLFPCTSMLTKIPK